MADEIVLAATFGNIQAAAIAKGMLETNDIPAIVDNATFSSIYPIPFNSLGEVRLMVRKVDLNRALQLLQSHGDITE